MTVTAPSVTGDRPPHDMHSALVDLCQSVLPVWGRHLDTARDHAEVAVAEMLSAFADIGPHLDMTVRQSTQINATLLTSEDGLGQLAQVCDDHLLPLIPNLDADGATAVHHVLETIHRTIASLERIAKPFDRECQLVSQQVERMYVGFQYQDRISQMMALLESDMVRLQETLRVHDVAVPELKDWLVQLESRYAMAEQRENHVEATGDTSKPATNETTFF